MFCMRTLSEKRQKVYDSAPIAKTLHTKLRWLWCLEVGGSAEGGAEPELEVLEPDEPPGDDAGAAPPMPEVSAGTSAHTTLSKQRSTVCDAAETFA